MATLLSADGRLLRAQAPAVARTGLGSGFPTSFAPMWSDGERYPNGLTDGMTGVLVSYDGIYRSQPVIRAVVDKLSRRIASLPFGGYRRKDNGFLEQVTGDSLDSLIRKPMPRSTTIALNHHIAQSLLLHGNALLVKMRTHGDRDLPPDLLWPLDWSQVSAYSAPGQPIEYWSTTQFSDNGEHRGFSATDALHFAWASPSGWQVGVSPLESLGVSLRIEDAAQRHQTDLLGSGVRPSLSVSLEKDVKDSTMELMRQSMERFHGGKPGKTLFLAGGAKVQTLSHSPVEAALIDQRKLSREEVGMVYDLAGPLMNDLTHGTYSNVEELQKGLYRDVIPPWTELIVQTYGAQLLDPEPAWMDRTVRFDFSDKLKGDPVELADKLKTETEAGLRKRNEARIDLGLEPDGDPDDPENPANQLTANTNNQNTLAAMGTSPTPPSARVIEVERDESGNPARYVSRNA